MTDEPPPLPFEERPDVPVTMPYSVASALFKAAVIGMDYIAAEPDKYEVSPEQRDLMRQAVVALGAAMKPFRYMRRYQ